jgi:hypothetical protein
MLLQQLNSVVILGCKVISSKCDINNTRFVGLEIGAVANRLHDFSNSLLLNEAVRMKEANVFVQDQYLIFSRVSNICSVACVAVPNVYMG